MNKLQRAERLLIISKILFDNPGKLFTLNYFENIFKVAKSTISEDITFVKETLEREQKGEVVTIAGAAGGIKYYPWIEKGAIIQYLEHVTALLNDYDRIMPGGFLYTSDIIFDPCHSQMIGRIFATKYKETNPDYIVTVETKGIPLALMTSQVFRVPLVIIRDHSRVTEGTSVNINYVSGSTNRIQTMSLPRRAMKENSSVLIIDDFMRGGGTIGGCLDLMKEFKAEVKGIGVLLSTIEPERKLVKEYYSLFEMETFSHKPGNPFIKPNLQLELKK